MKAGADLRETSILLDPIAAFALAMFVWAALIAHTFYMPSRKRRERLKSKARLDQERDRKRP